MYTLLSSLDEVAHFGGKTFAALGYAVQPKRGLSFEALVAHQKEFVEFANNLGEVERLTCITLADKEFRRALAYAGELFLSQ
eukprot:465816-Pleurochrysis_carterae.AAC.1